MDRPQVLAPLTQPFSRRAMLRLMGASAAAGFLPNIAAAQEGSRDWLRRFGPIDRTLGTAAPRVFLERAERFGGNSRGESWDGLDPVVWNGKPCKGFWEGATAPEAKPQFARLAAHFKAVYEERDGYTFPEIPILNPAGRAGVERLDRLTLREHLLRVMGENLHPHLDSAIEAFCWSSYGVSATEISAAAGLNFLAGEVAKLVVTPGGNAAVAERALERILAAVPDGNLRAGCLVFDVEANSDGARVAYEDAQGRVRVIQATTQFPSIT